MRQAGTGGDRLEIGGDGRGHEETGTDRTERDRNGQATGWSQKATAKGRRRRAVVEGGGSGQERTSRDKTEKDGRRQAGTGLERRGPKLPGADKLETGWRQKGTGRACTDRRRQRETSIRGRGSLTHLGNFLNLPPGALGREGVGTAAEDLVLVLH